MKNKWIVMTLVLMLVFGLLPNHRVLAAEVKDGTYQIQVSLWNAMTDKASMGNAALNQEAVLTVKDGKAVLQLEFKPMTFTGLTGYLSELDLMTDIKFNASSYPENYEKAPAKVISTYDVVDEFNKKDSKDSRCAGKAYPKELSLPVELGKEYTYVHVYVPIMGSFGAGDQEARLKLDYSTLKSTQKKQEQKLTLSKSSYTLAVGKTASIKATVLPTGTITYTSGNKKIATVSKKGVIKALKKGTVKITVTCNGVKKTVKVTVK